MAWRRLIDTADGQITLDVGRLIHPIVIWALLPSSPPAYDAAGPVRTWQPVANALAAIDTLRGREVIRSGQAVAQLYSEIVMWYQPGVLPNMQVTDERGNTYIVQSAEDIEKRNVVLRLNCVELGANE
jgi:head-tail adaptor